MLNLRIYMKGKNKRKEYFNNMVNLTVITIKDIAKYGIKIIAIIAIIILGFKLLEINKNYVQKAVERGETSSFISYLESEIPGIEELSKKENNQRISLINIPINMEYSYIGEYNDEEMIQTEEDELIQANKEVQTGLETEIIETGVQDRYTDEYNGVKVKNGTDIQLTENMLEPNIDVDKSNIIIYHTHTCESYTPTEAFMYEQTGNYRTTDLNYSVARVGDELENDLKGYGYNVIHDKTYHDYPAYTGSYGRSLQTVNNILSGTSADIIIDLHRDALGSNGTYAPTVKIGDEYAAQLMFVIGTNGGGLEHNNWNDNLKFAIKVQQKANELYPGLFKSISMSNSRYNQHVSKAASIIEVGATGNTMEQCLVSMKYLAKVIDSL